MDRVWESLDQSEIYNYSAEVLIYPIEPEKSIYMLLYPDGHLYLGEVIFTPYSEIIVMEDEFEQENDGNETDHRSKLVIPVRVGYGIWAGIDREGKIADFYVGMWKNGLPEDSNGFYVRQDLSSGSRFVFYGTFEGASLGSASSLYGTSDAFVDRAIGLADEVQKSEIEIPISMVNPFGRGVESVMNPAPNTGTLYDSDFENREFFAYLDNGEDPEEILHSIKKFHGLSIIDQGKIWNIVNTEDNTGVICSYKNLVGFHTNGFWGFVALGPEEEYMPDKFAAAEWIGQVGSGYTLWTYFFDWEGNVIDRSRVMYLGESPVYDDASGWIFSGPTEQ